MKKAFILFLVFGLLCSTTGIADTLLFIATAKATQPASAPAANEPHPFSLANIGDYIVFGAYEQDNNLKNGKEPIEWLVLAKENNCLLVISRYALDCKPYHEIDEYVTWEACTLRIWLNQDFLNTTFSKAEQAMIPIVTVTAHKNPTYDTDPGPNTQDRVFLLSITEVEHYLSSNGTLKCASTPYVKKQGVYSDSKDFCRWWLRSPGFLECFTSYISELDYIEYFGYYVQSEGYTIRPALWIYLGNGPLPENLTSMEQATATPTPGKTTNKATPKPTSKVTPKPNNATCSECGGDGKLIVSCNKCGGDGKSESRCTACSGSGVRQCSGCYAVGYIACTLCDGDGHSLCWKCSGRGKVNGSLCQQCGGTGFGSRCIQCSGKGILNCYYCDGSRYVSCSTCNGHGNRSSTCSSCNGGGKVTKKCTKCQ